MVAFWPSQTGQFEADISLRTSLGTVATTLAGNGFGPLAVLSGNTFFRDQIRFPESEGLASQQSTLTLHSAGQDPLAIEGIVAKGPFREKNTCPKKLAAGKDCSITLSSHPKSYDDQSGSLTIRNNAPGGPERYVVTGDAEESYAEASPASVNFGIVNAGDQPTLSVTVGNVESATLITSISVSGPFTDTTDCSRQRLDLRRVSSDGPGRHQVHRTSPR